MPHEIFTVHLNDLLLFPQYIFLLLSENYRGNSMYNTFGDKCEKSLGLQIHADEKKIKQITNSSQIQYIDMGIHFSIIILE